MFYPFTATMARKETTLALTAEEQENEILLAGYLNLAQAIISRAARRGYVRTAVYCPYTIRQAFVNALTGGGFEVEPIERAPNRYMVSWGE